MIRHGHNNPPPWAEGLGYGGLIPFVALALAIWFLPAVHLTFAASALLAYSATIASFLGAIHWGLSMRDTRDLNTPLLIWGVLPSLVAWVALLLPAVGGMLLMAAVIATCFGVDRLIYTRLGLRAWLPMRFLLTFVACLCCIAGSWGVTARGI